jgi:hypothetical protein
LQPPTFESLQIQKLADNVHDLAADPAPPLERGFDASGKGAENSSGNAGCLNLTLSAKANQGQCRISER